MDPIQITTSKRLIYYWFFSFAEAMLAIPSHTFSHKIASNKRHASLLRRLEMSSPEFPFYLSDLCQQICTAVAVVRSTCLSFHWYSAVRSNRRRRRRRWANNCWNNCCRNWCAQPWRWSGSNTRSPSGRWAAFPYAHFPGCIRGWWAVCIRTVSRFPVCTFSKVPENPLCLLAIRLQRERCRFPLALPKAKYKTVFVVFEWLRAFHCPQLQTNTWNRWTHWSTPNRATIENDAVPPVIKKR